MVEAENQAIQLGGNLVSINSDEENQFLIDQFSKDQSLLFENGHTTVHIGLEGSKSAEYSGEYEIKLGSNYDNDEGQIFTDGTYFYVASYEDYLYNPHNFHYVDDNQRRYTLEKYNLSGYQLWEYKSDAFGISANNRPQNFFAFDYTDSGEIIWSYTNGSVSVTYTK